MFAAVALALPLDVHKICETGLIDKDWQDRAPNRSVVCESHVAIVTRKGNPKNIKGWNDLTRYTSFPLYEDATWSKATAPVHHVLLTLPCKAPLGSSQVLAVSAQRLGAEHGLC